MLAMYAAAALAALVAALFAFLRHREAYWQRRKVPVAEPHSPLVGSFGDAVRGRKSLAEVARDIYRKYRDQPYIGTTLFGSPMLHLHDPDIIRQVFVKEFQDFNGRGMHSDPDSDPLSGNLFNLSGQPWRNMRVKLRPTFTSGKIKYMFHTISACAAYLQEHVTSSMSGNGGAYEEDVRELVARLYTDVIASVAFGIESNSMKDPDSEFRRMGQRIFQGDVSTNTRIMLTFFGGWLLRLFRIRSVNSDVHAFFTRIVDETVGHRERNGVERADMLNLLIKLKNEGFVPPDAPGDRDRDHDEGDEGNAGAGSMGTTDQDSASDRQKLKQSEIAAQVFIFFVAGFETTSSTASFALFELAKDQDVQKKLLAEVDAVLSKHGGKVTYEAVMDMKYMEMVMLETLRLYPAVPLLTREAMLRRKLPLTDLELDKGTRLLIPVLALHRDPEYWPEPRRFNPERFSAEAARTWPPGAYLPFGDGPRNCIGMRKGLVQVKMALITILSKCRVALPPGAPTKAAISPHSIIVPTLVEPCRLILSAR